MERNDLVFFSFSYLGAMYHMNIGIQLFAGSLPFPSAGKKKHLGARASIGEADFRGFPKLSLGRCR
jgi:hypothetical protein